MNHIPQEICERAEVRMASIDALFAEVSAPCCMGSDGDGREMCICGNKSAERALRGWHAGQVTSPMTQTQREFCLSEIDRVEGYDRVDYEGCPDQMLAAGVLHAWADFARDKGLL